jgi:transposase InsO family protein
MLANTKIKEFRTDNGTEYFSNAFQQYLKDNGIVHNTSVAYCVQSNGKAEGLNRTLLEKARCMIIAANVNLNLWTAAIDTANYLRNRSHHRY